MNQSLLPVTVVGGLSASLNSAFVDSLLGQPNGVRLVAITGSDTPADDSGSARIAREADLTAQLERLASGGAFDAVLIDAAADESPLSLAESLLSGDHDHEHEHDHAGLAHGEAFRIDTLVTVLDASTFFADMRSQDALSDRLDVSPSDQDDRLVAEALIEQIEGADVLVLEQADALDTDALAQLESVLQHLNPRAICFVKRKTLDVTVRDVIGAAHFDIDETGAAPGWSAALDALPGDAHEAVGATDEHGVSTIVYRARRPFHPARLWTLMQQEWTGVLRSKGFFWLATRHDIGGSLSQAGSACRLEPAGAWWAAQDRSEWPEGDDELAAEIAADWFGEANDISIGDRRQELVLIGLKLDPRDWQIKFDGCLVTEAEYAAGPAAWSTFDDPFPSWIFDEHDHDDHDH